MYVLTIDTYYLYTVLTEYCILSKSEYFHSIVIQHIKHIEKKMFPQPAVQ